jgi:hypothetical protein
VNVRHFTIDLNGYTAAATIEDPTPELLQAFWYSAINNISIDLNGLIPGLTQTIPLLEIVTLELNNDFVDFSTSGRSSIDYLPIGRSISVEFHKKT